MMAGVGQAMAQLFGAGRHREATEILVEHIMLVSPGADREMMLEGRQFDEGGEWWKMKVGQAVKDAEFVKSASAAVAA